MKSNLKHVSFPVVLSLFLLYLKCGIVLGFCAAPHLLCGSPGAIGLTSATATSGAKERRMQNIVLFAKEGGNVPDSLVEDGIESTSSSSSTSSWSSNSMGQHSEQTMDATSDSSSSSASWIDDRSAIVWLNAVAIIWGSQHAVIKLVVDDAVSPGPLLVLRFGLAALLASPYTPGLSWVIPGNRISEKEDEDSDSSAVVWRWGLEMGFWMFLGFLLQAIGLQYTTAQKSGFLLYLNVKFVPFFAALLYQRSISWATWASAATALAGTALLAGATTLNVGDAWSIAAALASAMFIVRLESATAAVPDAARLNSASLWVVTVFAAVWSIVLDSSTTGVSSSSPLDILALDGDTTTTTLFALFYLGAVTTAGANWIQTKAQRYVAAERAAVVYALDPVYGAVFAYLLLGERLETAAAWVGAGLIVLAAGANAVWDMTDHVTSNGKLDEKDGEA